MEDLEFLLKFKGCHFIHSEVNVDFLENMDDFEIREDDVFIVSYPKSGTVWAQHLLSLIYCEEYRKRTANVDTVYLVRHLEYSPDPSDLDRSPSPRLFCSHIPYYLAPRGLKKQKAKIIYLYRNPKDVMCSFFHFTKMLSVLKPSANMEEFMELFLEGKVLGSLWFDHIRGWCEHKSHFNIQFIMYENMIKDLRSSTLKVCKFLGKELSKEDMDAVVSQAMFENMKSDPRANYENVLKRRHDLRRTDGHFLRKGTIGDWKNHMTVAQNERFDKIFQKEMKDIPLKFIWDINEE